MRNTRRGFKTKLDSADRFPIRQADTSVQKRSLFQTSEAARLRSFAFPETALSRAQIFVATRGLRGARGGRYGPGLGGSSRRTKLSVSTGGIFPVSRKARPARL